MSRVFSTVFGIDVETPDITRIAVEATRQGYAVIPVKPMTKIPDICTLNARELREQGRKHLCGVHHAITDPELARKVFTKLGPDLNIGVVAWPSRIICVDADNADGVSAFLADLAEGCDDPAYTRHTPTVRTPGMVNEAGAWVHKDGGHFLFELPEGIELALGRQKIVDRKGYEIRWGWSMSLVPPSTRSEGRYETASAAVPVAPAWLTARIIESSQGYAETLDRPLYRNDSIARWSASVTWGELLGPDGWTELGRLDSCGCPVFTKPGGGNSNDRSATGHESSCAVPFLNIEGHGPLHLWTTEPPPPLDLWITVHGQTLTKLQYLAVTRFDGDTDLAMEYLGLGGPGLSPSGWVETLPPADVIPPDEPGSGTKPSEASSQDQQPAAVPPTPTRGNVSSQVPDPYTHGDRGITRAVLDQDTSTQDQQDPFWRVDETPDIRVLIERAAARQEIDARAKELREFRISGGSMRMRIKSASAITSVAVEASVGRRADGVALLYRGRVNTIWGPSESAKSWFSLACTVSTIRAGGRVLIVDTEDDENGFDSRMAAIGHPKPVGVSYVQLMMAPTSVERDELLTAARASDLIVVDSLDGLLALLALESNNATAVRTAGAMLKHWAQAGHAAVLVVDHSTDKVVEGKPATAMGSSAKKQLIDGVMLRADRETEWKPGPKCTTMIMLGKDRHGQVKQHAEYRADDPSDRVFGRIARLEMLGEIGGNPATLSLLKPPSYEDLPETSMRARMLSEDEVKAIEGLMLRALGDDGKLVSRTDLLSAAGDKNDRKGTGHILDELCRRNPPDGLLGGIKVHHTPRGNEIRTHYSWVSPSDDTTTTE
jgi:Bifunctional DNA primase/polymerase, N-terminal/AAA domain